MTVAKLFRVYRTCCEMLLDRNYSLSSTTLFSSVEKFREAYGCSVRRDQLSLFGRKDDGGIMVFFPTDAKVGVKPIRDVCLKMSANNVWKAILVVQHSVTPFASQELRKLSSQFAIEVFTDAELMFNVSHHMWVPPHSVLSKAQKREVLEKLRCKESQLPRILTTDPVARYYGLKRGQVCQIDRPSETAGKYILYRLVV